MRLGGIGSARGPEHHFLMFAALMQSLRTPALANAPHAFTNSSGRPARLLCICSPPGQENMFLAVGAPVATRTEPPPELDAAAQAAFIAKAQALAPEYHTELLRP